MLHCCVNAMILIAQSGYSVKNLEVCAEIQAAVLYDNAIESSYYTVGFPFKVFLIMTVTVAVLIDVRQNIAHDFDVFPVFVLSELRNDAFEFGSVLERIDQGISGARKRGRAIQGFQTQEIQIESVITLYDGEIV